MMWPQKLKSCIEVLRFQLESRHCPLAALVTTVMKLYQRMRATAMQTAVKIMKKDREPEMLEKDPSSYSFLTYLWVFLLAGWGGLVSFINKVKSGEARAFNFAELIGEICTAAFAGMLTFWLCELSNTPPLLTAALIGISGHMGSRLIFSFEKYFQKKYGLPIDEDEASPVKDQPVTEKGAS